MITLDNNKRYLQIAFNHDMRAMRTILPLIPDDPRIIIEAGTPYIKNFGMDGVRAMRRYWRGTLIADMKIADGAVNEIVMAKNAGANGVTCLGHAPAATLDFFAQTCKKVGVWSMVDMINVDDPLQVMKPLKSQPNIIVLHKGRDQELKDPSSLIEYRHVRRIRSKYNSVISVAGGVNEKSARSAIFNGGNIVVVNLVYPNEGHDGVVMNKNAIKTIKTILDTIA